MAAFFGPTRRKNPVRHEAMYRQFAPPHAVNKALHLHQRLHGTVPQREKVVPLRVRRPRESKQRAETPEKGSET